MSTVKISDLTALTSADNADLLLITDSDLGQSKHITVQNLLSGYIKNVVEDTTPQLGGTLDANGNSIDMGTNDITDTKVGQWDTAYGWGDHSTAGYLTSFTETDPVFTASDAAGITSTDISNWNTAYGWGDHASAGYLTSFTETNNLTAAVTWANIPDANVPQSAVTQHQAALTITESQISDLGSYIADGFSVTSGTLTTANITTADFGNYTIAESTGILSFSNSGTPVMQLDASGGFTIL